ncbi:STM4015 family protein [Lachnospiraceae bacterium 62-35]
MTTSKTYSYDYSQYDEEGKGPSTMIEDILTDPEFPNLTELIIGCWGSAYEDSCQEIIDGLITNVSRFSHIEKLFIGDMDFEECEVSWIVQGNYSHLWTAMPQLKELTIKGSTDLELGEICHEGLEALTIICGGLPSSVIASIQNAKLPKLKKLLLYIGVEDYGFDGNGDTIKNLLEHGQFPNLEYLGIADSEIQDELTEIVLNSRFMSQLHTLDLSGGTLTDKGGSLLLEKLPSYPNVKKLDVHYHYMSEAMTAKVESLSLEVDASEPNEPDEYRGEIYMNAMLTE